MVTRLFSIAFVTGILAGCAPELDDRASLVTSPRVLALASSPAEAAKAELVTFRALYVGPAGELSTEGLPWAFCAERKPLTELGPVAPSCLASAGDGILPIGTGAEPTGAIPADACRLFGPDRPEPKAGEPAGRPADPDPSGGYYQPFRVDLGSSFVTGAVRIECGLGGATPAQAATFREQYRRNEPPQPASLVLRRGEGTAEPIFDGTQDGPTVAPGERVAIDVSWPACSAEATCGGAESYLWFDPEERALKTRREGIRISWFVTAGELDADRTGRGEDEADKASSENAWTAPSAAGDVWLWTVMRDDRGGIGWRTGKITVLPR